MVNATQAGEICFLSLSWRLYSIPCCKTKPRTAPSGGHETLTSAQSQGESPEGAPFLVPRPTDTPPRAPPAGWTDGKELAHWPRKSKLLPSADFCFLRPGKKKRDGSKYWDEKWIDSQSQEIPLRHPSPFGGHAILRSAQRCTLTAINLLLIVEATMP